MRKEVRRKRDIAKRFSPRAITISRTGGKQEKRSGKGGETGGKESKTWKLDERKEERKKPRSTSGPRATSPFQQLSSWRVHPKPQTGKHACPPPGVTRKI